MEFVGRLTLLVVVSAYVVLADCGCTIKDPYRCDLNQPAVVSSFAFNGLCDATLKPKLKFGETYDFSITFTAARNYTNAKSMAKFSVFGLWYLVDIKAPNACSNSNLACPLVEGTEYTFETTLKFMTTIFPPVLIETDSILQWYLLDEAPKSDDNNQIFCVAVQVKTSPKFPAEENLDKQLLFSTVP